MNRRTSSSSPRRYGSHGSSHEFENQANAGGSQSVRGSIPRVDVIATAQNIKHNLHQQFSPASKQYMSVHTPAQIPGTESNEFNSSTMHPQTAGTSETTTVHSHSNSGEVYENAPYTTDVHALTKSELERRYQTDLQTGLDAGQVPNLLNRYGFNRLTPPESEMELIKWLKHIFSGVFNVLLWLAIIGQTSLYFIFPENSDRLDLIVPFVLAIVIVSAGSFQWIQERNSAQVMESFQKMTPQSVLVIRNGIRIQIPASQLVPGDLVILQPGSKIPADIRILSCSSDISVDNSSLTGESEPQKRCDYSTSPNPMETKNLIFFGTFLIKGKGIGIVFKTGDMTLLGRIASLASNKAKLNGNQIKSTFSQEIDHFVGIISWIAISLAFFCMIWDVMTGEGFNNVMRNFVLILIANIPEGLRPTVTLVLTLSAKRMAKKNVLIRNLESVETLGCVSVICSDKTGTITTGQMTVSHVFLENELRKYHSRHLVKSNASKDSLVRAAILCNAADFVDKNQSISDGNQSISGDIESGTVCHSPEQFEIVGYPTETALLRAVLPVIGQPQGIAVYRDTWEMVHEIPFNSENKWHLGIYRVPHDHPDRANGRFLMVMKGAPEKIVDYCSHYLTGNECRLMDAGVRQSILNEISRAASFGERVLCFAQAWINDDTMYIDSFQFNGDKISNCNWSIGGRKGGIGALSFIGFMSLIDPPREGVIKAIKDCQMAGIRVVMVTGDHEVTARAIAEQVGIISNPNTFDRSEEDSKYNHVESDSGARLRRMQSEGIVISGEQIDKMIERGKNGETEYIQLFWDDILLNHDSIIFARTTPMHKMIIVQEFQKRGFVVAVTGDGINDAPALNQANVGVSMGQNGTDVAREASDILLLDDNFSSIVHGIEEGRLITDNLKKSIAYTLCSKLPQLAPVLARNFFQMPLAMTMMELLLIDLGTDIWTGVCMAFEKKEDDLMKRAPRDLSANKMVSWKMIVYSYLHVGVIQTLGCFLAFQTIIYNHGYGVYFTDLYGLDSGEISFGQGGRASADQQNANAPVNSDESIDPYSNVFGSAHTDSQGDRGMNYFCYENPRHCEFSEYLNSDRDYHHHLSPMDQTNLLRQAQTGFYVSLILMQITAAICTSTRLVSIFDHGINNLYLNAILVIELSLGVLFVYHPFFQEYLETESISLEAWFAVTPFIFLLVGIEEIRKYFARTRPNGWIRKMLTW